MIFEEGVVDDEEEYDYDEDEEEFFEEAFKGKEEKVYEDGIIFEVDRHQTKLKIFLKLSNLANINTPCWKKTNLFLVMTFNPNPKGA